MIELILKHIKYNPNKYNVNNINSKIKLLNDIEMIFSVPKGEALDILDKYTSISTGLLRVYYSNNEFNKDVLFRVNNIINPTSAEKYLIDIWSKSFDVRCSNHLIVLYRDGVRMYEIEINNSSQYLCSSHINTWEIFLDVFRMERQAIVDMYKNVVLESVDLNGFNATSFMYSHAEGY